MPFFNGFPYSDYDQINLDWVIKTCKEALDTANVTKEYVDNYFDNLDVQEEINNKLQQMADDGDLLALMEDTITSVTDAWLADNITNPSNPPLDSGLTLTNAAAQAKATGDAIAAVAALIPQIDNTLTNSGEAADAKVTGDAIRTLEAVDDVVVEDTRNLWQNGDQTISSATGFRHIVLRHPLPAGTYTLSAEVSSTYTTSSCYIGFSRSQTQSISPDSIFCDFLVSKTGRAANTFILTETAYSVRICTGTASGGTAGYTGAWDNIQIEIGSTATAYIAPWSAIDHTARETFSSAIADLSADVLALDASDTRLLKYLYSKYKDNNIITALSSNTNRGVTFAWDSALKQYHVTGSVSSGYTFAFNLSTATGSWIFNRVKMGSSLCVVSTDPDNLYVQTYYTDSSNNAISGSYQTIKNIGTIMEAPVNAAGFCIRLYAKSDVTFDDYITYTLIDDPSIPLFSSNTQVDLAPMIQARLETYKYCRLARGSFQVSGIDMPASSMLEGVGPGTFVWLKTTATYAIKLWKNCKVSNMTLSGNLGDTDVALSSTVGTRHALLFLGDWSDTSSESSQPKNCILSDLWIRHFTGGALTCDNTGTISRLGVIASNLFIRNCGAGINIPYCSEYHRFTDCSVQDGYYGIVNNAGNNVFVNCDVSKNTVGYITKMVDGSGRSMPNNGHGLVSACTFNHIDYDATTLGKGYAIWIEDNNNGMVFSGGSMFYAKVYIKDSSGIMFTGFNFGRIRQDANTPLPLPFEIVTTDGGTHKLFLSNSIFLASPSVTYTDTNGTTRFICDAVYTKAGVTINV